MAISFHTSKYNITDFGGSWVEEWIDVESELAEDVGVVVVSECVELHREVRASGYQCGLGVEWVGRRGDCG